MGRVLLETERLVVREFEPEGLIEGSEHGDVEYATTREEWLSQHR